MITVRDRVFIKYSNGICYERMELELDSPADMPAADHMSGFGIYQGSLAHIISTGDIYAMDSTGTWYNQNGSGAYVPERNAEDNSEEGEDNAETV